MEPRSPESIADAALSLPPEERAAFVQAECAGDDALRAAVDARIRAHFEDAANATAVAASDATVETPSTASLGIGPGDQIGRYKLLQLIGEGGFGSVYMAEQTEPVRRRVALKVVKLGMDTKQVIARFEAERQALAMMDHPNIASVLDAGSTESGRPYFVMELVRGVPLTEYCDSNSLSVRERIELFNDVCSAVQHAHQKGIIHRDLKPSNILVTLHDTKAVPKVIDFGIAKATTQPLTDKTLFTEFRQFVGTPQYMSPEQAEMSGLDVDTRADVYSLGTILYELLTGATPFEAKALMSVGFAGVSQHIKEVEPPELSQRFTAMGEERTTVAKRRGTEPSQLVSALRGELQWIVTKSLEKDRTRRYDTANQLAEDLTRYLSDEPVLAMPPRAGYRFRKFVRRHRGLVATILLVSIALPAGLVFTLLGWVEANRALERSEEMSQFLSELHVSFDPFQDTDQSDVDALVERCRELFGEDHATIGSLLFTRASLLSSWGRQIEAEEILERTLDYQRRGLGDDHEALAATLKGLGNVYNLQARKDEALGAFQEAFRINRLRFGELSIQTAESAQNLASILVEKGDTEDQPKIREFFELAIAGMEKARGPDDSRTIQVLAIYGMWLQTIQDLEGSKALLLKAVERGRQHRTSLGDLWLGALNSLTVAAMFTGDTESTARYYAELIDLLKERGIAGSALIVQLLRYANWLIETDRIDTAREVLAEAVESARASLPANDPQRRQAVRGFAQFLHEQIGPETEAEAEELIRSRLRLVEAEFGAEGPEAADARTDLGRWLALVGREGEAAEYLPPTEEGDDDSSGDSEE